MFITKGYYMDNKIKIKHNLTQTVTKNKNSNNKDKKYELNKIQEPKENK